MPESKELAEVLSARNKVKYAAIIERAANNGYHDFKFESIPNHPEYAECICPKVQLVHDLGQYPELNDVKRDVMNGVYDDSPDESDSYSMRLGLLDDEVGDAMFAMLGFDIPTEEEREQHSKKKFLN